VMQDCDFHTPDRRWCHHAAPRPRREAHCRYPL
jgi:hypothetical protein